MHMPVMVYFDIIVFKIMKIMFGSCKNIDINIYIYIYIVLLKFC